MFVRLMARNKAGFVGFVLVIVIAVGSFIAPLVIPFSTTGSVDIIMISLVGASVGY